MVEQEIKLTAASARTLDDVMGSELLGQYLTAGPSMPVRYLARYLDTPAHDIFRRGCSFRIRKEGKVYRAAFKEKGTLVNGLSRHVEYEAEVVGWLGDPGKLPPGALRDRIRELVPGEAILGTVVTVDMLRRTGLLAIADTIVECALDTGHIHANDRTVALYELELELQQGSLDAVKDLGARLLMGYDLHYSTRTKHEVGMDLWKS